MTSGRGPICSIPTLVCFMNIYAQKLEWGLGLGSLELDFISFY